MLAVNTMDGCFLVDALEYVHVLKLIRSISITILRLNQQSNLCVE